MKMPDESEYQKYDGRGGFIRVYVAVQMLADELAPLRKKLADAKAEAQRICSTPPKTATVIPPPPPPPIKNLPAPLPGVVVTSPPAPTAVPAPVKPDCTQLKKACLAAMESYEKAAQITFDFPVNPDVSFCVNNYLTYYLNVDLPRLRQVLTEWGSARAAYLDKCSRDENAASTPQTSAHAYSTVPTYSPIHGPGATHDPHQYVDHGSIAETIVPSIGDDTGSGGPVDIATTRQPIPNARHGGLPTLPHRVPGGVDIATTSQPVPTVCDSGSPTLPHHGAGDADIAQPVPTVCDGGLPILPHRVPGGVDIATTSQPIPNVYHLPRRFGGGQRLGSLGIPHTVHGRAGFAGHGFVGHGVAGRGFAVRGGGFQGGGFHSRGYPQSMNRGSHFGGFGGFGRGRR
jgi:hypothetical protein